MKVHDVPPDEVFDLGKEIKSHHVPGTQVTVLVTEPGRPTYAISTGSLASIIRSVHQVDPGDVWDLYDGE